MQNGRNVREIKFLDSGVLLEDDIIRSGDSINYISDSVGAGWMYWCRDPHMLIVYKE